MSTKGVLGKESQTFHAKLSEKTSEKRYQSYLVVSWIQ